MFPDHCSEIQAIEEVENPFGVHCCHFQRAYKTMENSKILKLESSEN